MPYFVANGVRLHTRAVGAGPPVVMLHGLLVGNMTAWLFTGAQALAGTHRVHLYDLRGHGLSERPVSGYDVSTMTDDLEAFVDGNVAAPMDLVGHSYGALIALAYAQRHPERVRRLILVEAPADPSVLSEWTAFLSLPPAEMIESLPAPLQADMARGGRRARRWMSSLVSLATETTVLQDCQIEATCEQDWSRVQAKTLLVYGDRSACVEGGHRLSQCIPGAEIHTLAGGHYLTLDAPAELSALLAEFLDG